MIFYRYLIFPIMFVISFFLSFFNSKFKRGFYYRRKIGGIYPWLNLPLNTKPIWIHCSSGEFEYAKPIIRKFKAKFPNEKILVTYFSPTYAENIRSFQGVDMATPLPWDTQNCVRSFLLHHRPKCLLISRTDVWPEVLHQCKHLQIPTLLFSATLSLHNIKAQNKLAQWLMKQIYSSFTQIFCVSEKDKIAFSKITSSPVFVTGDTRYDQVVDRLKNPKNIKETLFTNNDIPILVAGSTWPQDEKVLLTSINKLKTKLRFVLVPHEPTKDHLEEMARQLKKNKCDFIFYSQVESWPPNTVLIVDQIGILAELYLKAQLAFVGGSFKSSVHSVMEPLAAGCLTFVGPYHENNREALEFKNLTYEKTVTVTYVQEIKTSEKFCNLLEQSLNLNFSNFKSALQNQIQKRTGTSDSVVNWVSERIRNRH